MIMCNAHSNLLLLPHSHLPVIHSKTVPEQRGGCIVALRIQKQQCTHLVQNPTQKDDKTSAMKRDFCQYWSENGKENRT